MGYGGWEYSSVIDSLSNMCKTPNHCPKRKYIYIIKFKSKDIKKAGVIPSPQVLSMFKA